MSNTPPIGNPSVSRSPEDGGGGGGNRPPEDREEVYFDGSPSLKGEVGTLAVCGAIAVVLLAVAVAIGISTGGLGLLVAIPTALVVGAGVFLWPVLTTRVRRYKVTNYRIDYERGLLSKRIDTLELWHVEDIAFRQSLWERMLGVGTLTVMSDDDTMPELVMNGLPEPRKLFDLLKQRVIAVKRQRGVLKLDT